MLKSGLVSTGKKKDMRTGDFLKSATLKAKSENSYIVAPSKISADLPKKAKKPERKNLVRKTEVRKKR